MQLADHYLADPYSIDPYQPINWDHPLANRLVSWWQVLPQTRGGLTWYDLAGRNHGNLSGMDASTDWISDSPIGQYGSLDFDGSNDLVSIGDKEDFDFQNSEFTIGVWVKWDAADTNNNVGLISKYGPTQRGWALCCGHSALLHPQGSFAFYYQSNAGSFNSAQLVNTTSVYDDGAWHLVVATFRPSSRVEIWVDGELAAEKESSVPASVSNNTAPVEIGSFSGNEFKGLIASSFAYSRAISAHEIRSLQSDFLRILRVNESSIYSAIASGGGGFQPAWAIGARRSQVIGSGVM